MATALERGKLGDAIAEIFISLQRANGVSLRGLSRKSGVRLTRLGNILSRGHAITIDEIDTLSTVLGYRPSIVVAVAECIVYGEAPDGLEAEDLEAVRELYNLVLKTSNIDSLAHLPTARRTKTPDASTQVIQLGSPHSTDLTALPKMA